MPSTPLSGDGSKGTLGIERPDLLVVAVLFALGVVGLLGLGIAGISSLGMMTSDAALAALVGGLLVLVPSSLALAYLAAHSKNLDDLEERLEASLARLEENPSQKRTLVSLESSVHELSNLQKQGATSHEYQEQAQDRMEASHERQEAKMLDLENRLEATATRKEVKEWMERLEEHLREMRARQTLLLKRTGGIPDPKPQSSPQDEGEHGDLTSPTSTYRMADVPGVSRSQAHVLEENGAGSTDTFLHTSVHELHAATEEPLDRLRTWKDIAELMVMIDGIDPRLARRLVDEGIQGVSELAREDPTELGAKLDAPALSEGDPEILEKIVGQARRFSLSSRRPATS